MEHIQTPLESHPPTQLQPMPSGKKFWTMRKGFIALAIFGCITFLILMSYLAYQFIRGKKSVSEIPEVLLNQPLYDFTGNIEQITGSQITVS